MKPIDKLQALGELSEDTCGLSHGGWIEATEFPAVDYLVVPTEQGEFMCKCEDKQPKDAFIPYWTTTKLNINNVGNEKVIKNNDIVQSPNHYKIIDGYEAIDIIEELLSSDEATKHSAFVMACYKDVLKYTLRALKKGNFKEDLLKAKQYIQFIEDRLNV